MSKVVDLLEYKTKKDRAAIEADLAEMGRQYEAVLYFGVCDGCGVTGEDSTIYEVDNQHLCEVCVYEKRN